MCAAGAGPAAAKSWGAITVKNSSRLILFVLFVALALVAPLTASARPSFRAPFAPGPSFFAPDSEGVIAPGPRLVVTQLGSAPAAARAGHTYLLRGVVANSGAKAVRGAVTVHLLRVGSHPRVIGATPVRLRARHSAGYAVRITIPRGLRNGSYAVVACSPRSGRTGPLGCATAERHVQIGPAQRLRLTAAASSAADCSSGAHTLSSFGDHVYPETGNGGYTSVHTDLFMAYDAATNLFLPGNHVDLTDRATQCLTDFSLDFERVSTNTTSGPNMTVDSVLVNGVPATFTFVQPTYPGDPNGQNDPDPNAHQTGQVTPVSATNPLPPACSPSTSSASGNGLPCPANKLVITPSVAIASGSTFVVTVNYTGRPGVHNDGDGTTEGWFRSNSPAGDGGFVTTEPVATEAWMPLNDHPTAKPTYDFYDTVPLGKTAIANGELISTVTNPPDLNFPAGSVTWHWHSPEGVASYLVENSVGAFDLSERIAASGIQYYEAQGSSITVAKKASNKAIMDQQEDIVNFQSMFNGTFPFTTDGVVIGIPSASFEEEMQTKITFNGGTIGLQTFNHENMHQWWGDNVAESNYNMTFYKEGMATLGEYLFTARNAQTAAGGPGTPAGDAAFETSLVNRFNTNYANTGSLWTAAPSNPRPSTLFSTATTYTRPGTAYLALREILGPANFYAAMQQIQHTYGGGTITESALEAGFKAFLPHPSASCQARLDQFFTQWFDTVYPTGGGANRPQITGPGLAGPGFFCLPTISPTLTPPAPTGQNGWYLGDVSLAWHVDDGGGATETGCVDQSFTTDGEFTVSCTATNSAGTAGPVSVTVKVDKTVPVTTATLTPGIHNGWYASPTLTLTGDDGSGCGVAETDYSLDGGPSMVYSGPLSGFTTGNHFVQYHSVDVAGHVESTKLIAFKVDAVKPSVTITAPADGAQIRLDKVMTAMFKCVDRESGLDTCVGTVPNGSNLDTSTVGDHTFTVTATDLAGNTTTQTVHYQVVYTWNGFFSPISNTEDTKLNLVHAGDLIKLGFALDGDRGLERVRRRLPDLRGDLVPGLAAALGARGRRRRDRRALVRRRVGPLHLRLADRSGLGRHLPPLRDRAERRHRRRCTRPTSCSSRSPFRGGPRSARGPPLCLRLLP